MSFLLPLLLLFLVGDGEKSCNYCTLFICDFVGYFVFVWAKAQGSGASMAESTLRSAV